MAKSACSKIGIALRKNYNDPDESMRFMGGTLHIGVDIPGDFFSFCDREVYFWSVLKDYKK